jgi:hypothetical protein
MGVRIIRTEGTASPPWLRRRFVAAQLAPDSRSRARALIAMPWTRRPARETDSRARPSVWRWRAGGPDSVFPYSDRLSFGASCATSCASPQYRRSYWQFLQWPGLTPASAQFVDRNRRGGSMPNDNRNRRNQPPTGEGKKQDPVRGAARKLGKRSEIVQAQRRHPELNLGTSEDEAARNSAEERNPHRPKAGR